MYEHRPSCLLALGEKTETYRVRGHCSGLEFSTKVLQGEAQDQKQLDSAAGEMAQ